MDVRQVYGSGDGERSGPGAGHAYVGLVGGPLDGQLLDVTGWSGEELAEGALLITDLGLYGPGGRAFYAPAEADPRGAFLWQGDTP